MRYLIVLMMFLIGATLWAADKPSAITPAQRAKFWRAAKELIEWQARALQAQTMITQSQVALDRARAEMSASCGAGTKLAEGADGEPTCVELNPHEIENKK